MSKFDAAINKLNEEADFLDLYAEDYERNGAIEKAEKYKKVIVVYRQAIRLLEAAGKIDKEKAYDWIDREYRHFTPDNQDDYHALMQIRALLEALPDEGKKEA